MAKTLNPTVSGRLGGLKGGPARANALSPERRSEIASLGGKASVAKRRLKKLLAKDPPWQETKDQLRKLVTDDQEVARLATIRAELATDLESQELIDQLTASLKRTSI